MAYMVSVERPLKGMWYPRRELLKLLVIRGTNGVRSKALFTATFAEAYFIRAAKMLVEGQCVVLI